MAADVEVITLSVNGFRFRGLAQGSPEGPLVLLLHGFPEFADCWLAIMPALAEGGFRAVAVDQRGYSREARPGKVEDYSQAQLVSDILGFADCFGATQFHLMANDWGGLLAWQVAAEQPARLRSLAVMCTPHSDAFLDAVRQDEEQKKRSRYIDFFRMPGGSAEAYLQADDWQALHRVYQGKVPEHQVEKNIRRLAEPGALTAALNWYRALELERHIGPVHVPTVMFWGTEDLAVAESAIQQTRSFVKAPFMLERLEGRSHWLVHEIPDWIASRLLRHLEAYR